MLRDRNGKQIELDQKLKRVVEGKGVSIGHMYKVTLYDWYSNGESEEIVADGGFQKELLNVERTREYEIVHD